jgi:hypothetical protein
MPCYARKSQEKKAKSMSRQANSKELEQKIGDAVNLAKRRGGGVSGGWPAGEFLRDAHARAFLATTE